MPTFLLPINWNDQGRKFARSQGRVRSAVKRREGESPRKSGVEIKELSQLWRADPLSLPRSNLSGIMSPNRRLQPARLGKRAHRTSRAWNRARNDPS